MNTDIKIIEKIKQGFDEKAKKIFINNEKILSLKSVHTILINSIKYGATNILQYILYSSLYRHYIDIISTLYRHECAETIKILINYSRCRQNYHYYLP